MVRLTGAGTYVINGKTLLKEGEQAADQPDKRLDPKQLKKNTLTYQIIEAHNHSGNMDDLKLSFDSIASHDITYVGVIQTAKASGMKEFPVPYILTNCHNSLCAVGGTLNEDDHMFGLSVAKKCGGIFVPPHQAVIHQYMREMYASCGSMILGSDSHTRYGALGTLGIGEGGGELVKQLLGKSYDIAYPEVIGVHLTGKPQPGVGPQDVALAIIRAVFKNGFVKNKVMEFFGDGIENLSMDYRNGIDVMTTETACLSSIWETDYKTKQYFDIHGRSDGYREMKLPKEVYYDGVIEVDLGTVKPMIALPFHPSNAYEIDELNANLEDILSETERNIEAMYKESKNSFDLLSRVRNGKLYTDQGVIAGCAGGTFENIMAAADILEQQTIGDDAFSLSVYPASQPVMMELVKQGAFAELTKVGATMRTAFCGPCFGAGDVPANNNLSIRHTTRNFPNREGSKPDQGQLSCVALMDARSIAATALNGGVLTSATEVVDHVAEPEYYFDSKMYENRIYNGYKKPQPEEPLVYGPNIVDWPQIGKLEQHLLLKVCSYIEDSVTTTDELIPSGDTSTFRSNPLKLAEFTLSRKDPKYVAKTKEVLELEKIRLSGGDPQAESDQLKMVFQTVRSGSQYKDISNHNVGLGSVIYAKKPGDGSAREQAASCQRVLGGCANICIEYATKRYRSNLINWGMIPFQMAEEPAFTNDSYLFIPDIYEAIESGQSQIKAYVVTDTLQEFALQIGELTDNERQIIMDGCLINNYRNEK